MSPRDQSPTDVPSPDPLPDPERDPAAAALARGLAMDAEAIEPRDRLGDLRGRIGGRSPRSWPTVVLAGAAAAAVVSVVSVALLAGGPGGRTSPAATTGPPAPSTSAVPSASGDASAPSPSGQAVSSVLPVYYLGRDGNRLALYREFHRRAVANRMQSALADAADPRAAQDGDLSSPWQPGTASAMKLDGPRAGVLTIDVPALEGQARGRTVEQARLAVQQLVWTASAVQQDAALGVRVLVDGRPGRLFGAYPVGDVVRRSSPAYQVLGSVWVEAPEQAATVASPVTVRGSACVFEATVSWQLLRAGQVVRSGFTTASNGCPTRGTWTVPLGTLTPGTYTFRAYEAPASGSGPDREDTRTFRVR